MELKVKLFAAILVAGFASVEAAQNTVSGISVGKITTVEYQPGFRLFKMADNSPWYGCNEVEMWASDPGTNSVTPDGAKSMLSVLLTAKATGNTITVSYNWSTGGHCVAFAISLD